MRAHPEHRLGRVPDSNWCSTTGQRHHHQLPGLDTAWKFSFEDHDRIAARLPRIATLYED